MLVILRGKALGLLSPKSTTALKDFSPLSETLAILKDVIDGFWNSFSQETEVIAINEARTITVNIESLVFFIIGVARGSSGRAPQKLCLAKIIKMCRY